MQCLRDQRRADRGSLLGTLGRWEIDAEFQAAAPISLAYLSWVASVLGACPHRSTEAPFAKTEKRLQASRPAAQRCADGHESQGQAAVSSVNWCGVRDTAGPAYAHTRA